MTVSGAEVLVANVGGTLLAYHNACGWCRSRLDAAADDTLGTLTCPSCERRFELRRAGRSPDDDALQIAPVPLLRAEGRVRVAVAVMDPALVAGLRRFARQPQSRRSPAGGRPSL